MSSSYLLNFVHELINDTCNVEGGYVNDADDLGGETNHGCTKRTVMPYTEELVKMFGWNGDMKHLTTDMALHVYKAEFWDKLRLDQIWYLSPALAATLFRWGIKSGPYRPAVSLQQTLNVLNNKEQLYPDIVADGGIGPLTLSTINSLFETRGSTKATSLLVCTINADQISYLKEISLKREKNEKYTAGWIMRAIREIAEYSDDFDILDI